MKKLLLFLMLIAASTTAFSQLRKDRTSSSIGANGAVDNGDGTLTMEMNFNSNVSYGSKGSDNSLRALQSIMLSPEAPVGMVSPINNTKTNRIGSGSNFYRFKTIKDLLDYSVVDSEAIYSPNQQYWKPVAAIVDGDSASDGVWANYPGMYKRSLFAFRAKLTDIGVINSDLSFQMMTVDPGNTGKTATYKMIVELGGRINNGFGNHGFKTAADFDTINTSNIDAYRAALGTDQLYVVDSVYTTSSDSTPEKATINVAQALGMTPQDINGHYVAVMVYTSGTGTNVDPGTYDPVIGIDNIQVSYIPASWVYPDSVTDGAILNYNNGNPMLTTSADYSGGIPDTVTAGTTVPIKLRLTGLNRASDLTITENNNSSLHNPLLGFNLSGNVMAKDASGNYTIPVKDTVTYDANGQYKLTIPLASGVTHQNDTIEVTLNAINLTDAQKTATRLEITNGARFWYNVSAIGATASAVSSPNVGSVKIYSSNSKIITKNATSNVTITNLSGQVMNIVSPNVATKGVAVNEGIYIVKTGNTTQKVLVK